MCKKGDQFLRLLGLVPQSTETTHHEGGLYVSWSEKEYPDQLAGAVACVKQSEAKNGNIVVTLTLESKSILVFSGHTSVSGKRVVPMITDARIIRRYRRGAVHISDIQFTTRTNRPQITTGQLQS